MNCLPSFMSFISSYTRKNSFTAVQASYIAFNTSAVVRRRGSSVVTVLASPGFQVSNFNFPLSVLLCMTRPAQRWRTAPP